MQLNDLVQQLDDLLEVHRFRDYCPNGLQVQGCDEVSHIITGVTASEALIDAAIEQGAQAILVHHGYFWKNESAVVVGMKKRRLAKLLAHDISLIAYHLPLDAHPTLGNNAQLAKRLGLTRTGSLFDEPGQVGDVGELDVPISLDAFSARIATALQRTPQCIASGPASIRRVAWCTGGAQGFIERAAALSVDAYLSGEISEPNAHVARECGLHYLAAGHHATERYGVMALGEWCAEQFGLSVQFVDIDNPA